MPEPEGRSPAFYDHEIDEPRAGGRRRRQVADWGVGEDAFDRLPSRRFERRGEEHRSAARHEDFIERDWEAADDDGPRRFEPRDESPGAWRGVESRDDSPSAWPGGEPRDDSPSARPGGEPRDDSPRAVPARGPVADWFEEPEEAARVASDGRRTIVIGGAVEEEIAPPDPRERRTIVIGGHPDGLPVVRRRRPPRTAVERVGTSPDRIAAYAVALGFLLILIAILTTGH
jgi:hypothetical protein